MAGKETILRRSIEINKSNQARETTQSKIKPNYKDFEEERAAQRGRTYPVPSSQEGGIRSRPINDAAATKVVEPPISASEVKALQKFLHFIRHRLKCPDDQSVNDLLTYAKGLLTKQEEELKLAKSNLKKLEHKVQVYQEKLDSPSLFENGRMKLGYDRSITDVLAERNSLRVWILTLGKQLKCVNVENENNYPVLMDTIADVVTAVVSNESEGATRQRARLLQIQQSNRELRKSNDSLRVQLNQLHRRLEEFEKTGNARKHEAASAASTAFSVERDCSGLTKSLEKVKGDITEMQEEEDRPRPNLAAVGTNIPLRTNETSNSDLLVQCEQLGSELNRLQQEKLEAEAMFTLRIQDLKKTINELESNLDYLRYSETQLLKFREVVAQLLNLECEELSVPDFEIVCRLEQMVLSLDSSKHSTNSQD